MTLKSKPTTRRTIMLAAAALTSLPFLGSAESADAAGTTPQASVKYQNKPNGANACGKCNYFLPGASPTGPGNCKVVAGQISPTGWCILFAPKAH